MTESKFDVVIIGGGSTGTAVARDCAIRGLSTLLLERDDIASATVGTCAGMISSGLKYRDEPEIMAMCSKEVVIFNRIARHIIMKNSIVAPLLDLSDAASDSSYMDSYSEHVDERDVPAMMFLTPDATLEIEPMIHPDIIASVYYEEYFIDPFRLCYLQALDAIRHGAAVRTYCEVIGFEKNTEGEIESVTFYNRISGATEKVGAKIVINASGPWAHRIAKISDDNLELRLNKGAHVIFDRRIVNIGITVKAVDGRWIYLFPHENTTLLGTTALDTWEDPDTLVASYDEIEYLLQSIETVIPSIRDARIIRTMSGVRPLVPEYKKPEGKVTRGYQIVDHGTKGGTKGLISFTGGKLVMCRHMAEAVTDLVCQKLGKDISCKTHESPLPGNEDDIDIILLSKEYNISLHALERMRARRGTEMIKVLELTKDHPEWKTTICTCEPIIEAELRYAIREEFPQTLNDLRRRLRLGTGPCQGTFCTYKAAAILSEELDLSGDDFLVDIFDFRSERWKGIRPSMRGEQLAQEELAQGIYACVGNLDQSDVDYDPKPWEEGF
ncbi:FAD-dependent oxidoreductase [Candidatus Thorarchaeota archaeon]|nr:MAG: FAD-dependent oxidoreductase [Candidatus Thorarchaeota archaeon]